MAVKSPTTFLPFCEIGQSKRDGFTVGLEMFIGAYFISFYAVKASVWIHATISLLVNIIE